jgi:hypothetical protein
MVMRRHIVMVSALSFLFVLHTVPARAQTTAVGPYYATPSWDQTLPSSTRFIVLSNMDGEAVLDRETGLVWQRSPDSLVGGWGASHQRCNILGVARRMGWRLPTVQELASLLDFNQVAPVLPAGHPFLNAEFGDYWSATPDIEADFLAWGVSFDTGNVVFRRDKTNSLLTWCVRGGVASR